ncbi:MAG TPA: c(7)-type cytochrome triheme domain-containing protein [Anaeromyxobacteraceae bacterium]|nr:c(7)-type cytochrome triheme domain-containing protein [Anaeromyxobacteraceae bacterium]
MSPKVRHVRFALFALALLAAGTAGAATSKLQRLPKDFAFPQGDGSPGQVTFSHSSHVDEAKPACLTCHPRNFRMLEAGRTQGGEAITHDRMKAGAACGACHGKTAFDFDTCDMCHK